MNRSPFSALPSYSSNPSFSKDDSSLLPSPTIGSPLAITICMIVVIIRISGASGGYEPSP